MGVELNKLKIAVTGFVGTGKTTLCQGLSEQLGLPIINEDMKAIAISARRYHSSREQVPHDLSVMQTAKKALIQSFVDWGQARTKAYQQHTGFVADRCEIDLLNWWLVEFGKGRHEVDDLTKKLLVEMQANIQSLDYLIFTPFVAPFSQHLSKNEQQIQRKSDFTTHLLFTALSLGLAQSFVSCNTIILPASLNNTQQKLDYILKAITDRPE